jgi:phosphatidylserine decarboxylase
MTGNVITSGVKIGMIKFGSQVDLHMPASSVICVKKGDKVAAGVSIMGKTGN